MSAKPDAASDKVPVVFEAEGTKTRMTAILQPDIEEMFNKGLPYDEHPGRRRTGTIFVPPYLELAAKRAISRHLNAQFRADADRMAKRVYHMELPNEAEDMVQKQRLITARVIGSEPIVDMNAMTVEERQFFLKKRQEKVERLVNKCGSRWQDIEYDNYAAHVYLAARLAPNYAVLMQIFQEIKLTDPSFKPKTLFDFGSGIGSTIFAANESWPHSISEHFNVDISKDMNNLSQFILRGGDDNMPMLYNGVYHREYLPLSSHIKYDLVVSAHSLMELPSRAARVQVIESLWNKTADLLVIAETGSRQGFHVVLEARNLILEMSGYDVTKSYYNRPVGETAVENYDINNAPKCHILAPCSHHYSCPRMDTGGPILCNYHASHRILDIGQKPLGFEKERYSYIVIRKGPRRQYDQPPWPRINQEVLKRGGHIICRACCPDGGQKSVTFTRAKHKGHRFHCARYSKWGDLLPMTIVEEERPLSFWDKVKRQTKFMKENAEPQEEESDEFVEESFDNTGKKIH
jgi:ribosomal protein RSM22 (predicted rRNA methylase)